MMSPRLGFTLVEMMVVIAIFVITTVSVLPLLSLFEDRQTLGNIGTNLVQTLRLAQGRSISGVNGKPWGVNFSADHDSYALFNGVSFERRNDALDITTRVKKPFAVCVIAAQGNADATILFPQIASMDQAKRIVEIYSTEQGGSSLFIEVYPSGPIALIPPPGETCRQ